MPRDDRFGEALAVSRAKYGPRRKKPWAAALWTTLIVLVLIGGIITALVMMG